MSQWLEISLPATPDTLDALTAALAAHGFDSFQVEDSRDFTEYSPFWDMADDALIRHYTSVCRIIVYLPDIPESLPQLELLKTLCPALELQNKADEDWAENWKQYYKPLPIGNRLLIQPAWLPTENLENRAVFLNNPGMSFGTGLHASTRLCLQMTDGMTLEGQRVLDIGCGSGILSLCALLLGAEAAVGIDIDPLAAGVAKENAKANGLSERFSSRTGNFIEDITLRKEIENDYGLVFSNIVADVIIALAPMAGAFVRGDGYWVVSGIISPRLPDVSKAVATAGFSIKEHRSEDGWEALCLQKS